MERLTSRVLNDLGGVAFIHCHQEDCDGDCLSCSVQVEAEHKLKKYEDEEEQGLLLRLDSKDKLIEVLATKLLHSEFGNCYMCTNPMKNITLDGINNGCDGGCNTSEEFTVDDFLKKIIGELQRKEEAEQKLAKMKEVRHD